MRIPVPQRVGVSMPGHTPRSPRGVSVGAGVAKGVADVAGSVGDILKVRNEQDQRLGQLEADELRGRFEESMARSRAALSTITDPDERLEADRKAVTDAEQAIRQQIRGRFTGQEFDRQMAKLRPRYEADALKTWETLRNDRGTAMLETGIGREQRLAAGLPLDDDAGFQERVSNVTVAIGTAAPFIGGEDAAAKRIEAERAAMYNARATREAWERPGSFLATHETKHWFLDPQRRSELVKAAEQRRDHLLDQAQKVEMAREKRHADALKADKEALVTEFAMRLRTPEDRTDILRDLNLRAGMNQIDQKDYDRIYDAATKTDTRPSDPEILARVGLDSQSANPRTRPEEIDRLHDAYRRGQPGLNFKDADQFKGRLKSTAESWKDEGRTERNRKYSQAEQELRAWLGIRPGMVERVLEDLSGENPIARLYAEGLAQLRARSFDGQEDPFSVVDELGPRLQRRAGVTKEMQAETIRQSLLYPTREALEQAHRSGAIQRAQYLYELRQISRMDRLGLTPTPTPQQGGQPPKVRPRL